MGLGQRGCSSSRRRRDDRSDGCEVYLRSNLDTGCVLDAQRKTGPRAKRKMVREGRRGSERRPLRADTIAELGKEV